jgi:hypothetical protein
MCILLVCTEQVVISLHDTNRVMFVTDLSRLFFKRGNKIEEKFYYFQATLHF